MILMNSSGKRKFVLASASPRRAQLLALIGLDFSIKPSYLDETRFAESDPAKHVLFLSRQKAQCVAKSAKNHMVIGADTIVVLGDDILGKPKDNDHAFEMLKRLSGNMHKVYTGFTIIDTLQGKTLSDYEMTKVTFRTLSNDDIERYIDSKSPMDKAGAYGIQDFSAVFVEKIEGCFYNVVGFPLARFYESLQFFKGKTKSV